jgi:hypothetical protein
MPLKARYVRAGALLSLVVVILAGCGGPTIDQYLPDSTKARESLEIALNAWKDGKPNKTVDAPNYKIDVFDSRWQTGAKLQSFEIIAEEPRDPHPAFRVKTRINGKEEEVKYVVMGIDPINIFREQEYRKATGK